MASREDVLQALATVQEPDLQRDLVSLDFVRHIQLDGDRVVLKVALTTPATPHKATIEQEIRSAVGALPGVTEVELTLAADPPVGVGRLRGVRHVIGVGAGKGDAYDLSAEFAASAMKIKGTATKLDCSDAK